METRNRRNRPAAPALAPDFVLTLCEEKVAGAGEDAFYYCLGEKASVAAAFDGCGGSGAKRYERARNKTGAYLAARVAAGATRDWFGNGGALREAEVAAELLRGRLKSHLGVCKDACDEESLLRGSLTKDFPTTCAVVVRREMAGGIEALALWAGDSRCYLLDEDGLHQLSNDDLGGLDAMENLSADGVLTNVVSASARFAVRSKVVALTRPCVLFAATDGCFGYLSTPMEFEYLLLKTLSEAKSPAEWERGLRANLTTLAGDDVTLCGLSLGFGGFRALVDVFEPRCKAVYERYVRDLASMGEAQKSALWQEYRLGYETA